MAPVASISGLAHCTLNYTLFGQQIQNGLYFMADGGESLSYETLGDDLIAWWTANMRPLQGSNLTLRSVEVRGALPSDEFSILRNGTLPLDGGVDGESLPSNVALVVTLRSATIGRKARGRNYVPAIPEGHSTGASASTTFANGVQAAYQLLVGDGALTDGWQLCIASRVGGGPGGDVTNVYPVVAAVVRDTVFDSQRRRLPGRGK